ncbi:MAG TPA: pyruvoyl-dependent arginine decarboxylase [Methanocella sp.]|nr:pyruvoyl-dependent arginine decarboxylase [Methanocella sp.]
MPEPLVLSLVPRQHAGALAKEMFYSWKKENPFKISHVATSAEVDEEGSWTTVISAAVFIL